MYCKPELQVISDKIDRAELRIVQYVDELNKNVYQTLGCMVFDRLVNVQKTKIIVFCSIMFDVQFHIDICPKQVTRKNSKIVFDTKVVHTDCVIAKDSATMEYVRGTSYWELTFHETLESVLKAVKQWCYKHTRRIKKEV